MSSIKLIAIDSFISKFHQVRIVKVDFDVSSYSPGSLVVNALLQLKARTQLQPVCHSEAWALRNLLKALSGKTRHALNKPIEIFDKSGIQGLCSLLDNDIASIEKLSDLLKLEGSQTLRKLIKLTAHTTTDGYTFFQALRNHKSAFKKKLHLPEAHLSPQIATFTHTNSVELRKKTLDYLQGISADIEKACASVIENYENVYQLQTEIISGMRFSEQTAVSSEELFESLKYSLFKIEKSSFHFLPSGIGINLKLPSTEFFRSLPEWDNYCVSRSRLPWWLSKYRLPNIVLTSIFVLLLLRTGWNKSSVGALQLNDITHMPDGTITLQSYKGKTDDQTPKFDITKDLYLLRKALELLIWNQAQLKTFGIISNNEERLWHGWQKNGHEYSLDPVGPSLLEQFITSNKLPSFTSKSLRPLRASIVFLPQQDLEAVRVILGHSHLEQSSDYLKNTLFFRLNEAVIFEFQNQIEKEILYFDKDPRLSKLFRIKQSTSNGKVLYASGCGTSCSNIYDDPDPSAIKGEICGGLYCHTGCTNHRIIVNPLTLEIALRTQQFYRSRWQRMLDRNSSAFAQIHVPRIIYIYVLLEVVKNQRPFLLEKANAAIAISES